MWFRLVETTLFEKNSSDVVSIFTVSASHSIPFSHYFLHEYIGNDLEDSLLHGNLSEFLLKSMKVTALAASYLSERLDLMWLFSVT